MSPRHDCPKAAELQDLLRGRIAGDRAGILEMHVGECRACQNKVDRLIANLHWLRTLSGDSPAPHSDEEAGLQEMIARLDDLAAPVSSLPWTDSDAGDGDWLQEERPCFEPPETAGEVGRWGPYRLLRLLGEGGMGLVYLAEDTILRRPVALKLLRPYLARLPHARNGFLSEARAMAAVKHDSIVTVFQIGEMPTISGESVPFLAMESLEGESLAEWLRREGPLPAAWAARLGQQAAEGLALAHARGVIHRDLKPANLWLEAPRGWINTVDSRRPPLAAVAQLKILDFGLAQAGENAEREGGPVFGGTPAYMPPEQVSGKRLDPAADLFSLGVVLYELTSGRLPFSHFLGKEYVNSEDRGERASDRLPFYRSRRFMDYRPPIPLRELAPNVPAPFADLVHRLLAIEPAARPNSAEQVAAELAALAAQTGSFAPVRRSRRRILLTTSAPMLLALLAVGAWFALRTASTTDRPEPETPSVPLLRPAVKALPASPDEKWRRAVSALPVERQPKMVIAKLQELNPDYDGAIRRLRYEYGKVAEFGILTDGIRDIRPVQAFATLRVLECCGSEPDKGRLTDLSPIRGMGLTVLNVWQNPALSDLSPLRAMKLTSFQAGNTAVEDLSPLQGMPLTLLGVNKCRRLRNVAVVRTLPALRTFLCDGCPITTLEPLAGTPISELLFDYRPSRGDAEVLQQMPELRRINNRSSADFWRRDRQRKQGR
jgi:eukaryotic-like serine/threonine-protein kinase